MNEQVSKMIRQYLFDFLVKKYKSDPEFREKIKGEKTWKEQKQN